MRAREEDVIDREREKEVGRIRVYNTTADKGRKWRHRVFRANAFSYFVVGVDGRRIIVTTFIHPSSAERQFTVARRSSSVPSFFDSRALNGAKLAPKKRMVVDDFRLLSTVGGDEPLNKCSRRTLSPRFRHFAAGHPTDVRRVYIYIFVNTHAARFYCYFVPSADITAV